MRVVYKGQNILLPDFLIIGAAKSGTSSLNYWLDDHSQVFMPEPKEPNFFRFSNYQHLYKECRELKERIRVYNYSFDGYQGLFKGKDDFILGDASTSYIRNPDQVISNIKKYYGDDWKKLKVIALLRNPVEKVYSHYLMFVKWGVETRSFREAVVPEYKIANDIYEEQIDYLSPGFYYEDLKQYQEYFGKNFRVYLFDDLLDDKRRLVSDCMEFIGVDISILPSNLEQAFNKGGIPKNKLANFVINRLHKQSFIKTLLKVILPKYILKKVRMVIDSLKRKLIHKPKLDIRSKQYLAELYKEDIALTAELIDRDLSHWVYN